MATIKETLHNPSDGRYGDSRLVYSGSPHNRRPIPTAALSGLVGALVVGADTFRAHRDSRNLDDDREGAPMLIVRFPDGEEVKCVLAYLDGVLDVSFAGYVERTPEVC